MSRDDTPPKLNLDDLGLDDDDENALETLSALQDEVRAPVITPSDERFPPLKPPADDATPAEHTTQQDAATRKRAVKALLYNALTVLALLGIIPVFIWIALVWQNPQSAYNPFPPPTPFVQITATPGGDSAVSLPGMPTPNEQGQVIIVATETQAAVSSDYDFTLAAPGIQYTGNENTRGCEWASIAGNITDSTGDGLTGYRVRVTGDDFQETAFSGTASSYGAGGYEVQIASEPVAADFRVQLLDVQSNPLAEPVRVTTRAACEENVARVNFVQVRP